jgi:hypothetical protein
MYNPSFLDLGISWRWVVGFTFLQLYPWGKSPLYPLDRRLGKPLAGLDDTERRTLCCLCSSRPLYRLYDVLRTAFSYSDEFEACKPVKMLRSIPSTSTTRFHACYICHKVKIWAPSTCNSACRLMGKREVTLELPEVPLQHPPWLFFLLPGVWLEFCFISLPALPTASSRLESFLFPCRLRREF